MTPCYLNFRTTFPIDLNEDQPAALFLEDHPQQCNHLSHVNINPHVDASSSTASSSSSSYPTCRPIYFNPSQDKAGCYSARSQLHPYPTQIEHGGGSYNQAGVEINNKDNNILKLSVSKKQEEFSAGGGADKYNSHNHADENSGNPPVKWMSSKMRHVKKMMKADEKQKKQSPPPAEADNDCPGNNNNNNKNKAMVRVCADCNTTKTPLWRSGPRGPKSLCNACGIRQRKARRAMAAAAAANSSGSAPPPPGHHMTTIIASNNHHKKTSNATSNINSSGAHKKRPKLVANKPSRAHHQSNDNNNYADQRKICFEEFALTLSKKLSIQQVLFPEEERDAAILLMALSCGLIHG